MKDATDTSRRLGENVSSLRKKRGFSQAQLAKIAKIPRSTLAHIESGSGNPSLSNLANVSTALAIGIEELLAKPRAEVQVYLDHEIPKVVRKNVTILKLLPDSIPGMEIDQITLAAGGRFVGTPHLRGTKEYLYCLHGEISLLIAGDEHYLSCGSLLAFDGSQAHSYVNRSNQRSVCFSVVARALAGS